MSLMLSCEKKQSSSDQMLKCIMGFGWHGKIWKNKDWWHIKRMWDLQSDMVLENHIY